MKKQIGRWTAGALAAVMPLTAAISLAGCGAAQQQGSPAVKGNYESLTQVEMPESIGDDDWEAQLAIREENPLSEDFIRAVNRFSYASAAQILKGKADVENRNYSPVSLYYALALAAQGAEGDTKEEFLAVLGMHDQEELSEECGRMFRRLYLDNKVSKLKLADSLWLKEGECFKEGFLKTAQNDFYASVFQVDFADPETGKAMGQWIAEQTNGTLMPELESNENEMLAIINTVYLYDEWQDRFLEEFNTEDTFTPASGEPMTCEYMNREFDFNAYCEGEGYTGTSLRLKNTGCMVLILPDEGVNMEELLTEEKLREMFENRDRKSVTVDVSLPKFKFQDSMELTEILKEMGMENAFDSMKADFSSVTDEQIYVSRVKQETHIGIDEKGAEASAYTIVEREAGAAEMESEIYELKYNRPFLFGIVNNLGIPLFLGICNVPEQV